MSSKMKLVIYCRRQQCILWSSVSSPSLQNTANIINNQPARIPVKKVCPVVCGSPHPAASLVWRDCDK